MQRVDYEIPYRPVRETNADMFWAAKRQEQREQREQAWRMREKEYQKMLRQAEIAIKAAGVTWVAAVMLLVVSMARIVL